MIPVILHPASGHISDENRPRSDRSADAGDFGDLLSALADEGGKPTPTRVARGETTNGAPTAPPPSGDTAAADPVPARQDDAPTLMERLTALLQPASATSAAAASPPRDSARPTDQQADEHTDAPAETVDSTAENRKTAVAAIRILPTATSLERSAMPRRPDPVADDAKLLHAPVSSDVPVNAGAPARMPDDAKDIAAAVEPSAEASSDGAPPPPPTLTNGAVEMAAAALPRTPAQAPAPAPETTLARLVDPLQPPPAAPESHTEPTEAPASLSLRILLRETHFAPVTTVETAKASLANQPAPFSLPPTPATAPQPQPEPEPRPVVLGPPNLPAMEMTVEPARPALRREAARNDKGPHLDGPVTSARPADDAKGETLPPLIARDASVKTGPAPDAPAATVPQPSAAPGTPLIGAAPPPVTGATPSEQIGAAIQKAGAAPFGSASPFERTTGGPVRILEIQLNPLELGVVTVRLRNGRDGLEIRVQAARAETAQLLAQDRSALLASLTEQGHAPADLTITSISAGTGLTGHDVRGATPTAWRAPDEDAGGRQQHSGARRDEGQNQKPPARDPDDFVAE